MKKQQCFFFWQNYSTRNFVFCIMYYVILGGKTTQLCSLYFQLPLVPVGSSLPITLKCVTIVLNSLTVAAAVLFMAVPAATASEVLGPMCLMMLLGTVHCQIVSTESSRTSEGSLVSSLATIHPTTLKTSPSRKKR